MVTDTETAKQVLLRRRNTHVLLRFVWGVIRKEDDSVRIPRTSAIIIVANIILLTVFLFSFAVSMDWLSGVGDGFLHAAIEAD